MHFVYILRTLGNALYVGVTENIARRLNMHNSGKGANWMKANRGAQLVYSEPYLTLGSARKREVQLKKWSRAKKEALIVGDAAALKKLSRSRSQARSPHARARM
jgi:putative endonuclease